MLNAYKYTYKKNKIKLISMSKRATRKQSYLSALSLKLVYSWCRAVIKLCDTSLHSRYTCSLLWLLCDVVFVVTVKLYRLLPCAKSTVVLVVVFCCFWCCWVKFCCCVMLLLLLLYRLWLYPRSRRMPWPFPGSSACSPVGQP